jgi:hypothetical protein
MEYLLVKAGDRGVIVNGSPGEWRTNEILQLQEGTYLVTLAPPADFAPPEFPGVCGFALGGCHRRRGGSTTRRPRLHKIPKNWPWSTSPVV